MRFGLKGMGCLRHDAKIWQALPQSVLSPYFESSTIFKLNLKKMMLKGVRNIVRNCLSSDLIKVMPQLKKLSKQIEDIECGDWSNYFNPNDPDEMFQFNTFMHIGKSLNEVIRSFEYMNKPVVAEGILHRNRAGRYNLYDHIYYTSGSGIEFLYEYSDGERVWVTSRVEHNGIDYYIVSYPDVQMGGLHVRYRS